MSLTGGPASSAAIQKISPNSNTVTQPGSDSSAQSLSFDQVQNYWVQAGGNPQASEMAAAVADATSGLDPSYKTTALDGQPYGGLWGILQGTSDPLQNARLAITRSNNGTDWSSWPVAWSDNAGGSNGGTYLGDGSYALAALGRTGTYNVVGATPTGTNTSASTVGGTTTTSNTSSKLKSLLLILLILGIIIAIWWYGRRHATQEEPGEVAESRTIQGQRWNPEQESQIIDPTISDKELSSQTGRSVRAIRVRRNQIKERG